MRPWRDATEYSASNPGPVWGGMRFNEAVA